jgi:hypothetical protein
MSRKGETFPSNEPYPHERGLTPPVALDSDDSP